MVINCIAGIAIEFLWDAAIFRLIKLETRWAYETLVDANIIVIICVLFRTILNAFSAQVQRVVWNAGLTSAHRGRALVAWLLANLTYPINRRLILRTTRRFASLVEVEHVARFTLCACLAVTGALSARICAILALLSDFVPDLSLSFTEVDTCLPERIQFHVRSTFRAGLRRASTLETFGVTFDTLVANLHALKRYALIYAALMVEEFIWYARCARRWQAFAGETR